MFYDKEMQFLKAFLESCKIKTHVLTKNDVPDNIDTGIRQLLNLEGDYKKLFCVDAYKDGEIYFYSDIFGCKYIFIPLPDVKEKTVLVAGPYITKIYSKESVEKGSRAYAISPSVIKNIHKYFTVVPYLPDENYISIAVSCFCDVLYPDSTKNRIVRKNAEELSDVTVLVAGKINKDDDSPLLTIQMIEKAYEQENRLLNAISQGLLHKAEMYFTNTKPSKMLESRLTDSLRNAKNFLIVLNTLSRKAVEQGGVHPIYIDSVSSDFALKIEACKSTDECDELFFEIIKKYSRLVQKHSQKGYSLLVQKVITCIDTDITADLSLKTQAKLLNVNPSYLSALFKKETGVTLTDYVNKRRVERAKSLLKNNNIQIQTVAQSCGMLDVNYFTKIFKKYEGTTPKEYREKIKA